MTGPRLRLERLEAGAVSADGRSVFFRVVGTGGETVTLEMDHRDLHPAIAYLAGLGGHAAAAREEVAPATFGHTDRVDARPIESSDIGLVRGLETGEILLVARLFGFDLAFTATRPQLAALHREIERALPRSALDPSHHHQHDHHGHDRRRGSG